MTAPPPLPRWLLRRLLSAAARSAIVGDLDEEFAQFAVPRMGVRQARRWYWHQAWRSVVACRLGLPDPPLHPEQPTIRLALTRERETLMTDLRYALRQLTAHLMFSVLVVFILALAIGANTAVFSVANALLLRKLPIAHADRLVFVQSPSTDSRNPEGNVGTTAYLTLARDAAGFEAIAAISTRRMVSLDDGSARALVSFTSGNMFETLGVRPAVIGRLLARADDRPEAAAAVVLDYNFWQRQFGGDARVIGRVLRINQVPCTIVGVAPREFFGVIVGEAPDVWIPLELLPQIHGAQFARVAAHFPWLQVIARHAADEPPARGRASAAALWRYLPGLGDAVLRSAARGKRLVQFEEQGPRLAVLAGLVVLVLIVGCLNIATLLGARGMYRTREFGIRAALGAGRARLLRQLLVEHLILAGAGGAAGLALGVWLARGMVAAMSDRDRPIFIDLSLDGNVLLFTTGLSILTALAFGLSPALQAARVDLLSALSGRQEAATTGTSRLLRLAGAWWLVPAQVAFVSVVLVAAGLFAQTFQRLHGTLGVRNTDRVLLVDVGVNTQYEGANLRDLFESVQQAVERVPGVTTASLSTLRPLARSSGGGPVVVPGVDGPAGMEGRLHPKGGLMPKPPPPPPPPPGGKAPFSNRPWFVGRNHVSPAFFQALGLPIVRGRGFSDADRQGAPPVVIINETFARNAFPGQNPIGRRLQPLPPFLPEIEIVGVVADLRYVQLRDAAPEAMFLPLPQAGWNSWHSDLTIVARTAGDAGGIAGRVQQAVREIDPRLPIMRVWTLEEEINNALVHERLIALLATTMGGLTLVLALAGIYGVVSYAVVRRTREMGIRLALGATRGRVRLMILRESVFVVAIGLAVGLPLASMLTRYTRHLLYGIEPTDPATAAAAAALLIATALVAAFLPAQRASRVDPVVALRAD